MKKYKIKQPLPQFGEDVAKVIEVPYELVKEIRADAFDDFVNACKENIMCQTFGLHQKSC